MSYPTASAGSTHLTPTNGFWPVVITNAVLGLPAYFIAFLFAYGFRDVIGLAEHVAFLVLVAIFAAVAGLVATAIPWSSRPRPPAGRRAAFGVQLSLALNAAVVGVGSIVSATHKEENSVSADFSTQTDVLVATVLFVVAAALAFSALRLDRRDAIGG